MATKKNDFGLDIPLISAEEQKELTKVVKEATYLSADEKKSALAALKKRHPVRNVRLEDYNIAPRKTPQFTPEDPCDRLYNVKKNEWLEHEGGDLDMYEILDTLSFAVTKGKLNSRTWVKTVFKNAGAWEWFLEELAVYEQIHRIRDPWWWALASLAEHEDFEEGFSTAEDMSEALAEHAEETNQAF